MSQIWAQTWTSLIPDQPMISAKPLLLSAASTALLFSDSRPHILTPISKHHRRRLPKTCCDNRGGEAPLYKRTAGGTHLVDSPPIPATSGSGGTSCSITIAFTSMVFMLRGLQSSALQMRQLNASCQQTDLQSLLASVQMDMHCSLLWLFQRVFSSTPTLMLTLMIILANFVEFNLERISQSPPPAFQPPAAPPAIRREIGGDSASDVYISGNLTAGLTESGSEEESLLMVSLLEQAARQHRADSGGTTFHAVEVTLEIVPAPVSVRLEADNYECFDRTEILYQEALSSDRRNPLLLANYAEFLFLVRRDYERAHTLFSLAMNADPDDAEILRRYAKFVWLVKGDKRAAERAYRAAMAAEPSNPFYAGCYAHFLWHSGEEQAASRLIPSRRKPDQR